MMIKKMMTMIMAKMVMIGSRIMKTTAKSTIAVITVTSGLDAQTRLIGHFPLY